MCLALREQGVEVLLASTDAGMAGKERRARGKGQAEEVPTILFPVQWGQSFKYSRPFAKWLDEHVSDFNLVHIHAVFNHACIAAARACRRHGVAYVVRPLGTLDPWGMKQKSWRKKVFWHSGIKKMLTSAAAIHYTSNGEKDAVEKSLGLNHGVVVPLGVDMSGVEESEVGVEVSNESPFPAKRPYVLVLSRLVPTKGLDALLDAFISINQREEFRTWRLVLAGEGPADYVDTLKLTVKDQQATNSVVFTGWLDGEKKREALRNASLLALPSHHESFGLCVIEALACGVPVLISPEVSLAAEIKTSHAGWISAVDRDSLEAALNEALLSDGERVNRGKNGRQFARQYSWPTVTQKLEALYADISRDVDRRPSANA